MQSLTRRQIGFLVLLAATLNGALWTASPAATELAHPDAIGLASGSANDPIPADRASPSSGLRFAAATAKSNARPSSAVFERVLKHPELPIPRGARWQAVRVLHRESLAAAFKREGIPSQELALLMRVKTFGQLLTKVRPGTELEYQLSADHQLHLLRYPKSRLQTLVFERVSDRFEVMSEMRVPETRLASSHAVIDRSLIASAKKAGLSTQLTMALAKVFQWDIDLALDVHPGDSFSLLYEAQYVDGEHIRDGAIVAAEFVNHGHHYQAIRFTGADGQTGYYTPDGRSMHKAFLRAPLEFSRVSSNFTMRRMHPITGIMKPHLGIDYAAAVGTPVWAAGDGRVTVVTGDSSEGKHIAIAHGERYLTRYLHLSGFARGLHTGEKVRQGQIIGYVGQTGLATGPHLHFEFLEGGIHKNPGNVTIMDIPIPSSERSRFAHMSTTLLAALDSHSSDRVALNLPARK